jgi:hypothetical protein
MMANVYVALLSLCLALAAACGPGGGDRESAAGGQPPPTQTAATPNMPAAPAAPNATSTAATAGGKSGACRLLTSEDVEAVQGEAVKEVKGSEQASGPLLVGQCFYTTPTFNKSVSLTLTQKNPAGSEAGGPKEFWRKQFGGEREREERERGGKKREGKERERGAEGGAGSGEEEEEGMPAQRVKGIGDEAYWVGNQKVGVLYVLKGDQFLRVSIGGPEEQRVKTEKMKALAKRALARL